MTDSRAYAECKGVSACEGFFIHGPARFSIILAFYVQVYTAEEKAALAMYNFEENKKKEEKIIGDMQRLVDNTLGGSGEDSEQE